VKAALFLFILSGFWGNLFAQQSDTLLPIKLDTVTLEAFRSKTQWKQAAAASRILSEKELQSAGSNTLLSVMNTVAGLRMEERSPGSYRLSIRGSMLRSPFGVRNVKVYWNGFPLSDGGGNTYLNLVDLQQFNTIEILKGPSGSLYGAGTGGVILLNIGLPGNGAENKDQYQTQFSGGSYGMYQENLGWTHQSGHFKSIFYQGLQASDGYREQSAMHKKTISYLAGWDLKQHQLELLTWYTDLNYQTPGGITLAQMQLNPTLSRQAAGALPGAIQQQSGIFNKTVLLDCAINLKQGSIRSSNPLYLSTIPASRIPSSPTMNTGMKPIQVPALK